jgi:hypothetical protein
MEIVADTLSRLRVEAGAVHENLAVFPLFADAPREPDYLTLEEALAREVARVTEVSEGGSVPELFFDNRSSDPILLVDGEELVGAKQNRILNLSLLIGGNRKVKIPVSCVERGRWGYRSREFGSAGRNLFAKARAAKAADVSESLSRVGERRSDQGRLWADIDAKMAALECESPTAAMADVYEQRSSTLDGYSKAFKAAKGQLGAVFAIDGRVVGMELHDSDKTFEKFLRKLVGSYALDAVETAGASEAAATLGDVKAFLARVQAAAAKEFPSTDLGLDVRFIGKDVSGGALVHEGKVVHLSAFAGVGR